MRRAAVATVGMLLLLVLGKVGPAGAQVLSPGCIELNQPTHDGMFTGQVVDNLLLFQGEVITVTATAPFTGSPTQVVLRGFVGNVDRFLVTAAFPNTVMAVVPATEEISVRFRVIPPAGSPTATFNVVCTAAPYPLAVTAALPSGAGQDASMLLPIDGSSASSERSNLLSTFGVLVGIVAVQVLGVGLYRRRHAS